MTEPKQKSNPFLFFAYFILFLWVLKSAEELFHLNLYFLTINPAEITGLAGILFAPLLHSDWGHLAANSFPLFLLGSILFYGYPLSKWKTFGIIWLVSGIGVWLFGRPSYHLGASGLVSGIFYFIFVAAILRRDKVSIALMFIAVLLFGSVLLGILPWDPKISFESHLFGAIGGVFSAFLFRHQDPQPQRKIYEWEGEEESDWEDEIRVGNGNENEPVYIEPFGEHSSERNPEESQRRLDFHSGDAGNRDIKNE